MTAATCNGVCQIYRALKIRKQARYEMWQKRCNSCKIFIYWDGLYGPIVIIDYELLHLLQSTRKNTWNPKRGKKYKYDDA